MLDFFKKLLPNFEKRRLVSQVEMVSDKLDVVVRPTLGSLQGWLSLPEQQNRTQSKFANQLTKDLQRRLRTIPGIHNKNIFGILDVVTTHLAEKNGVLGKYVQELFGNTVATSGLTFKQAEVIRLVDLFLFWCTYTMKVCTLIANDETVSAGIGTTNPLMKPEEKWIADNYQSYLRICEIVTMPIKDFNAVVEETSELIINEAGDNPHLLGIATDPFKLGFMPGVGSVILFIRMQWLNYETKRYEANKLRLTSIQLQVALLQEKAKGGEVDEATRRQIDYYLNRIKDIEYQIHKYEEKLEG